MKIVFAALFVLFSTTSFAGNFGKVDSNDLKYLLEDCENSFGDAYVEAQCLRYGIMRLIQQSEQNNGPSADLTCRSGSNGKFAVYDEENNRYIDDHYGKTDQECKTSISYSYTGLLCSVGASGKYAVRRIRDNKYISPYFSISFDLCNRSLALSSGPYICIAGEAGKFARYNMEKQTYLDSQYSLSLEECMALLPQ